MKAFALIYFLYEKCALGELLFFFIKKVHSSSQIQCQQYQTQRFQAAIVHLIRVKIHRREDELLVLKEEIFRKKMRLLKIVKNRAIRLYRASLSLACKRSDAISQEQAG